MINFLLDLLALGPMFTGILLITSKNPVISVLFLNSVFVFLAGLTLAFGFILKLQKK